MKLTNYGIKIGKDYPKLKVVKFETDQEIFQIDFDFFIAVEEEKEDFFIQ